MTKYYLTSNNKEVKMGEKVSVTEKTNDYKIILDFILTESNKDLMIKNDVIYTEECGIPTNIEYYIEKIAERTNLDYDEVDSLIDDLAMINPMCVVNMILKEISKESVKTYNNPIGLDDIIYIFSNTGGKLIQTTFRLLNSKTPKAFAFFPTYEDGKKAVELVKPYIKEVFGE